MKNISLILLISFVFFTNCSKDSNNAIDNVNQSGSITKFAIINNYLYTINNYQLVVFDIQNKNKPTKINAIGIPNNVETIFAYNNNLYLGSTTGIFIVDIQNPSIPLIIGSATHTLGCDPVIVKDTIAYSTIRNGRTCNNGIPSTFNQLIIYNVKNSNNPIQINQINMIEPQGLSIDGNNLFVCDGRNGLIVFDISDLKNPIYRNRISVSNAIDVISVNETLIISTSSSYALYSYSNINNIIHLSDIQK